MAGVVLLDSCGGINTMNKAQIFKSEQAKQRIMREYRRLLESWPVEKEELVIETSYGKTFVMVQGDRNNPPLILLHGSSMNSAMWLGDIEAYSRSHCVYTVDLPGEPGLSEAVRYSLTGPVTQEWLHELIQALGSKKVSLLGVSLGGWMALRYATIYPESVSKLSLICPSGIYPQKVSFILRVIPLMFMGDFGFRRINQLIYHKESINEQVLAYSRLISESFNPRMETIPVFTDEELQRLSMPVLYIGGDKDVMLHSSQSGARLRALLPHVKTIILKDTGHVIMHEAETVIDFLKA